MEKLLLMKDVKSTCKHVFDIDPWEPGVQRCIYCTALYEDVVPIKLPEKLRTQSLNSTVVRALRHYKFPGLGKKIDKLAS